MKKEKLWIFGDSHCDPTYRNDLTYVAWPVAIKKTIKVINYSVAGSGPDYQLQRFIDAVKKSKKEKLKNISVFFVIPSIYRFNLKFINNQTPRHQSYSEVYAVHLNNNWDLETREKMLNLVGESFGERCSFLDLFLHEYVLHSTYTQTEMLKIITILKEMSKYFKKMYVVSAGCPVDLEFRKGFSVSIENTKNFYCSKDTVYNVFPPTYGFGNDPRNNHLPKHAHKNLLTKIENWLHTGNTFDFKEID